MPVTNLPRIYSYKLSRDFGFAPNPFHGFCTLATCKPQIRNGASVGDIIIGCGSKELERPGRIIFAMKVSEKLNFQEYWDDPRFEVKKVNFYSGKAASYGDNIYHMQNKIWLQEDSHHSFDGGLLNEDNLKRDIGSDNVLVGSDFIYWGAAAPLIPPHLRNLDGDDIYPDGRFFRSIFSDVFRSEVDSWFKSIAERGYLNRPTCW